MSVVAPPPTDLAPVDERDTARFHEPRKLHGLTPFVEALRRVPALAVPAGVFIFTQDRESGMWVIVLAIIGVMSLLRPTLRYLVVRYHVSDAHLVIHEGLLVKVDRSIPVERIQNIDIKRALVHRMTGVAEMRIETAGGSDAEGDLAVVSMSDAVALRALLLELKRGGNTPAGESVADVQEDAGDDLVSLGVPELLVAGATENRIGVIVAAIFGLTELVNIDVDDVRNIKQLEPTITQLEQHQEIAAVLAVVVLILAGWFVSIVLAAVTYHGFRLRRRDDDLRSRYGLLTQHEATIPLARLQALHLEANPLRRLAGRLSVTAHTAGSGDDSDEGSSHPVLAPILRETDVADLTREVLPKSALDATPLRAVHPRSRRRAFLRAMIFLTIPTLIGTFAWETRALFALIAAVPVAALYAHLRYRSLGYALTAHHVITRSGIWTRRMWVVPLEKVQTVAVHSSPFQRRLGLATVSIDTAGGHFWSRPLIIDIPPAVAEQVLEELSVASARTGSLRGV